MMDLFVRILITIVLFFSSVLILEPLIYSGMSTPQGKNTDTKAVMSNLKCALINFKHDLGRYPFDGESLTEIGVNAANDVFLGLKPNENILITLKQFQKIDRNQIMGLDFDRFVKLWKGPYLDFPYDDLMLDAWGTKIRYCCFANTLCLHSAGADKTFDLIVKVFSSNYEGDDILLKIDKFTIPNSDQ
ncbi:MAG: hypothetical protein HQM10_05865 [Candidatus Riflebacteria bacterium]|nr:hypothetical protein [Candidatus Riflebacteria bacterium]